MISLNVMNLVYAIYGWSPSIDVIKLFSLKTEPQIPDWELATASLQRAVWPGCLGVDRCQHEGLSSKPRSHFCHHDPRAAAPSVQWSGGARCTIWTLRRFVGGPASPRRSSSRDGGTRSEAGEFVTSEISRTGAIEPICGNDDVEDTIRLRPTEDKPQLSH